MAHESGLIENRESSRRNLLPREPPADYPPRPMRKDNLPLHPTSVQLAVVNWEYPDRSVVTGCPVDYEAAVAMSKAYQERYPDRRAWISIPPPLAR